MLVLITLICLLVFFLVFQKNLVSADWRVSFLAASVSWGVLLTAITEFLSIFKLISFWGVLGLWILSLGLALLCLIRAGSFSSTLKIQLWPKGISRLERFLLASIVFIVISIGIIGYISPPNTIDSMTYHMSRVVHWLQNKGVENYPTHISRQLYQNPWAEFAIMHFQILSNTDRLANLVQWFSMIGTTIGISLLAKQLGASTRGQIFTALISVTIPMGILQGSSTQNDYVVSFWLVCVAYFAILLTENGKILCSLAVGASLGLALLTKATAYIYAFPLMAWVSLALLKSYRAKGFQLIFLIVIAAVVINLGYYSRNYELYRNPLGPGQEGETYKFSNETFSISSVTSNVIRNLGLHIGTPFNQVNTLVENGIFKLHEMMGIDPNDPRTTWAGTQFHITPLSFHEVTAGNPLHLMLIMVSLPLFIFQLPKKRKASFYAVCLMLAFILFCLVLKWQPWHSRLHLPLFILWSPLIGIYLSDGRDRRVSKLVLVILLEAALPLVLFNSARPIFGQQSIFLSTRSEQYFNNDPSLREPYINSAQFLLNTKCSDIGLMMGQDDWEYPFWVALGNEGGQTLRIEHINVTNVSNVKYDKDPFYAFSPCAVVVVSANPPGDVNFRGSNYLRKWFSSPVSVFMLK